jgi:hypothetical protein
MISAHVDGEIFDHQLFGFCFRDTQVTRFTINRRSNFSHLKQRIEKKLQSNNVGQIIYKNPVCFADNQVKFYQRKIRDDDDVQHMFGSHEQSGYNDIELYILPHQQQESQYIDQSQVFCETDDEQAEVNVPDDEEEEPEIIVDSMVNAEEEEEPIPAGHVYCPPQHMTRLNLGSDEPSGDVWYNPYVQMQGSLKQGDTFRTKEECVKAIKKFHMELSADFRVDRTDALRYKIYCPNEHCLFKLSASYRKRKESWEIGSMGPDHTCILTNPMQDHRKLSSQLICDEILSVISDNPSLKVSTIISHIKAEYEYTPSYRKAWIARTKAVEKVFGNWEESYK